MTLDELRNLITQMRTDPAQASDEQLSAALDAIRAEVATRREQPASTDTIAALRELLDARNVVVAEQNGRAETAAAAAAEQDGILAELDTEPPAPEPVETTPSADQGGEVVELPVADNTATTDGVTDPAGIGEVIEQAVAAAVTASIRALHAADTAAGQAPAGDAPQGRPAGRIAGQPPAPARGDVATAHVYVGANAQQGTVATTNLDVARAVHERWRGPYQANVDGRFPVIHVDTAYPDARILGSDAEENFRRMEAVTSPQALVAAGGLCAPLETLYDVEVIGSANRPVRDSLARFGVERGGIQYRPNTSAAAAVWGAGVWTLADDAAGTAEKTCYQVDCPGLEDEVVEAVYLCLEFSNITTRYDPEVTASNVRQGLIAHARLAENRLLQKLAAGSKLLSAPRVIGATRDILANLDKATAYYRNRHRIDDSYPLTFLLPGWVKSLVRADLARQMAAGDWMEALGAADNLIDGWFARRSVSPVWHLDGPAGVDEVQTVTVTGTPTGGTFTLTFDGQTTAPIAYNATAASVRSALAALTNLEAGDIAVAGGPGPGTPYTVTFSGGAVDGRNVPQMSAAGSFTGGTSPAVAVTTTTGGGGAITVSGVSIASQTYGPTAAGDVLPGFPDQIDALLFPAGSWLFLDGGSLDLGLVRDSALNAKNRYRQFSETFEGAAFRGVESLRLVMTVQPTGQTSGTADLTSITD